MSTKITALDIIDKELGEVMGEKYLAYALSTIMSRSLPDVRDGLKPVHRRLLYAMSQLHLKPEGSPKKCARVVGDVIGKFHPHGDQSVYDALVRLSQDFAVRYPLVDGQGNFGNIDGDNAAAMRYTEARMTVVAQLLLEGIEEDAVDFRETYDGETQEPIVLPGNFPNLLANGSTGIAVGMATSIPPHNVAELCIGLDILIQNSNATVADLMEHIQGPDLPTGGYIVEDKETILKAYQTGRGSFRVRSKWEREDLKQGLYQIVITEIPYQVQKSRLIERIADLIVTKKLPFLDDVVDESTEDIRVVLTPKNRNVDPAVLMESLYRYTDLENRFSMNMNALDNGVTPRVMDIKEMLQSFINHRRDVLLRRTQFRLDKIATRLEALAGYMVAYLNLDEVIRIIREEDNAKLSLIERFELTEGQADAILNMRLRSLRKLEEIEIRKELDSLKLEQEDLDRLMASPQRQTTNLRKQFTELAKIFSKETELGARRTIIKGAPTLIEIPVDAMIEKEPVTIVCSEKGWIRAMKGHVDKEKWVDFKYKDGDKAHFVFHGETTDKILVFATNGRFYTLGADKLPSGRGFGEPIQLMIDLGNDVGVLTLEKHDAKRKLLLVADDGRGFIVAEKDVVAQTKNGKQVLNVKGGVEAKICVEVPENADSIAVIGQNRKLLIFPLADLPEMGRGRGVILQKYKDCGVSDAKAFIAEDGLSWTTGAGTRIERELMAWLGKRAQAGRLPPNGFPLANRFSTV